jgi:hypothetical protein
MRSNLLSGDCETNPLRALRHYSLLIIPYSPFAHVGHGLGGANEVAVNWISWIALRLRAP